MGTARPVFSASQDPAAGSRVFASKGCEKCHAIKPEVDLNERGKFLLSEKEKQKAKEVKPEWLKNYTGK